MYIILQLLRNIRDNKNITTNRSKLHTRLQYNFYWLLTINLISKQFKSVSPKISRIGRQKGNNGFFLIRPKEPFWWTIFGNDIKRFDYLFLSSKFANLKIRPQGLQWRPYMGLKFGTCLTCSYGRTKRCLKISYTQCLWHLLRTFPPLLLCISRAHAIHDVAVATSCISSARTESKLNKI